MSKVLITADIHLHDFRSHNIQGDPLFRLNQFELLSKRLVDICESFGCDTIIIAGDFFHVASPRPYIFNRGVKFLKDISKSRKVYITPGQHDLDTRSGVDEQHTLLSACSLIDNVYFLHDKAVTIGNREFYFKGWTPEIDTSYIPNGKFDVYIGHVTVESSKIGRYNTVIKSGQVIENHKFKICFCGDIHKHQVIDNIVIPGCPIQASFNDDDDNAVIILDTEDLTWKRVTTRSDQYKFLTFKYDVDVDVDSLEKEDYVVIKEDIPTGGTTGKTAVSYSFNVDDMVKECLNTDTLKIHERVSILPGPSESVMDYSFIFSIGAVSIRNFRSIKSLDIDFSKYQGVMFIHGKNGSGKSVLLNAINFCLALSNSKSSNISYWANEMSVSVTINYDGLSHTIVRGFKDKSYTDYYINGEKIEAESQAATRVRILNNLKFLSLYDIMYHDQDRPRFLSSYNYSSRVDLISRVLGINRISALNEAAKDSLISLKESLNTISSEISSIESYLAFSDSYDFSELDINYSDLIDSIEVGLEKARAKKDGFKKLKIKRSEQASMENEISILLKTVKQVEIKDYDSIIFQLEDQLIENQKLIAMISNSVSQHNSIIIRSEGIINGYANRSSTIVGQIDSIKSRVCYVCHQPIGQGTVDAELSALEKTLSSVKESYEVACKDLDKSKSFLTLANKRLDEANSESDSIKRSIMLAKASKLEVEESKRINSRITELQQRSSALSSQLESDEKFYSEYNEDDIDKGIEDLVSRRSDFMIRLASQKKLLSVKESIREKQEKLKLAKERKELASLDIKNMEGYMDITSVKGPVIKTILTAFSDNLSTDLIRILTTKELANGSLKPDFNVEMRVGDKFLPYDELSGGQKIVCDIFVIKSLIQTIGGIGSIIFDETFGELDSENLELAVENLRGINAKNVVIVSHEANFPYYDAIVSVRRDSNASVYDIF